MLIYLLFEPTFYQEGSEIRKAIMEAGKVTFTPKLNELFMGMSFEEVQKKHGYNSSNYDETPEKPVDPDQEIDPDLGVYPESFDWRTERPFCYPKHSTPLAYECRQVWLAQAVSDLEQRICVNSTELVSYSTYYIIECDYSFRWCQREGSFDDAYNALIKYGTPSTHCYPHQGTVKQCATECTTPQGWPLDNEYFTKFSHFSGVANLQRFIQVYPVTSRIRLYEDFLFYGSGPYFHYVGEYVGFTGLLMIGWIDINTIPCWICRTAYGPDFGNMDGFVYIVREKDECGIESNAFLSYR